MDNFDPLPFEGGVSKGKRLVLFYLSPFEEGVSKGKRWFTFTFHLSREGKRMFMLTFHLSREESRKVKDCLFSPFTFRGRSLERRKVVDFDLSPFEGGVSKGKRLFICPFYLSREDSRKVKSD